MMNNYLKICSLFSILAVVLFFVDQQKYLTEVLRRRLGQTHDDVQLRGDPNVLQPPFVMILCNDGSAQLQGKSRMNKFNTQLTQAKVLIKSAVTLARSSVRFIILGNDDSILPALEEYVAPWPQSFRHRLHLSYRPVFFPEGWQLMNLYEKCVTEKLFLPWVLPELDAVVYMDTDHVFMRPPEHLTQHFRLFNEQQVLGVAPVDGFYLQFNTQIPFYGKQGLSSALLLANLTKWRRLPFQWQPLVTSVAQVFREGILGDQEILNIIFSEYPEYIYDLSCDWSGIIEQCISTNWNCSSIEDTGFSLVHGARHRFFPDQSGGNAIFTLPMHEIFQAWHQHQPGQPVSLLLRQLMHRLHIREDEVRTIKNNNRTHLFCLYSVEKLFKQMVNYVHEYEGNL